MSISSHIKKLVYLLVVGQLVMASFPLIQGIQSSYTSCFPKATTQYNGTLSGYVTDSDMNPLDEALIHVAFHGTYEENYSDVTGYYHVTDIPICYCLKEVTCSKQGYIPQTVWLAISENTVHDFVLQPLNEPCYPVLNGTMGLGNWYVSNVTIYFVIMGPLDAIYYRLDGGSWQLYIPSSIITVNNDGGHTFEWYYVYQENESNIFLISFKIDQTPPIISIDVENIGRNKWSITVDVFDETSGFTGLVEFKINGNVVFIVTEPPYVYIVASNTKIKVSVGAYDFAGNYAEHYADSIHRLNIINCHVTNNNFPLLRLIFKAIQIKTSFLMLPF